MTKLVRKPKLKGMIDKDDPLHGPEAAATGIAPTYVSVPVGNPVPQYSSTVIGSSTNYDPQGNCEGNSILNNHFINLLIPKSNIQSKKITKTSTRN